MAKQTAKSTGNPLAKALQVIRLAILEVSKDRSMPLDGHDHTWDERLWTAEESVRSECKKARELVNSSPSNLKNKLNMVLFAVEHRRSELETLQQTCWEEDIANQFYWRKVRKRSKLFLRHWEERMKNLETRLSMPDLIRTAAKSDISRISTEAVEEGPELPNKFHWDGKTATMRPIACKLLHHAWPHRKTNCKFHDIRNSVWDDCPSHYQPRLKAAISEANGSLSDAGISLTLKQKKGYLVFVWRPAGNRKTNRKTAERHPN
jgi:hypothetical protein